MKIGITGHQEREGIDWSWVKDTISAELRSLSKVDQALSSLAAGSDQVFAGAAISLGIPVTAVIPLDGYEQFFKGSSLAVYRRLLSQCKIVHLTGERDPEKAFLKAGQFIVDQCDLLMAVWDGGKADGKGGTGDIVEYAHEVGRTVIHINPILRVLNRMIP